MHLSSSYVRGLLATLNILQLDHPLTSDDLVDQPLSNVAEMLARLPGISANVRSMTTLIIRHSVITAELQRDGNRGCRVTIIAKTNPGLSVGIKLFEATIETLESNTRISGRWGSRPSKDGQSALAAPGMEEAKAYTYAAIERLTAIIGSERKGERQQEPTFDLQQYVQAL